MTLVTSFSYQIDEDLTNQYDTSEGVRIPAACILERAPSYRTADARQPSLDRCMRAELIILRDQQRQRASKISVKLNITDDI